MGVANSIRLGDVDLQQSHPRMSRSIYILKAFTPWAIFLLPDVSTNTNVVAVCVQINCSNVCATLQPDMRLATPLPETTHDRVREKRVRGVRR